MPGTTPYCETCDYHTINTKYPRGKVPPLVCTCEENTALLVTGIFDGTTYKNARVAHSCPSEFSCDKHVPKSKL